MLRWLKKLATLLVRLFAPRPRAVRRRTVLGRPVPRHWNAVLVAAKEVKSMATIVLDPQSKIGGQSQPVDINGGPASIDGVISVESSDPNIVAVVDLDQTQNGPVSFVLSSVSSDPNDPQGPGNKGTATITISADADMGSGMTPISVTLDVIVDAQAVGFGTTFGAQVPR